MGNSKAESKKLTINICKGCYSKWEISERAEVYNIDQAMAYSHSSAENDSFHSWVLQD